MTFGGGTLATTATFTLNSNRGIAYTSTGTVDVASGTTLTYGGIAAGAGGLTKTDTGTLTLSGASTYSGATTINGGILQISADNNLGAAPGAATPGQLTFGGGTLATTATFTLSSNRGIAFTSTGTIDVASGTTVTYGGIAAGAGGLTKTSAGTLTISGANAYSGATTIGAGTLKLGVNNSVPSGSAVTATGTFDLAGFVDTIGSLAGGGTVTDSSATASTLTAGGDNTSTTFSGVIQNGSGTIALTKAGTGTMTLSGANTYTSATTINAGTLKISADNNLGAAPGAATPGQLAFGGGTLATTATFTLNSNRGIAFTSTGTIDVASGTTVTYGGIAAGAGGLTKTDTGTLTLGGTNAYGGTTTVSAGTLLVNGSQGSSAVSLNGGTLGGSGTVGAIASTASGGTIDPGTTTGILSSGNINWSTGNPTFLVQLNGTTAGSGYDQLSTSGTINLTGATLSGFVGFTPTNGSTFTIVNNTGGSAITGTFSGLAEGATVSLSGWSFKISYLGGSGHSVVLTAGTPVLALVGSVSPSAMLQSPGTDLAYTITFTNNGGITGSNIVISDPIPNNTDFKVGSATSNLGTTGLTLVVAYSNNGGATYAYTPVSAGGGAPVGYDRNVTNVRWTFTGTLSQTSPNNTGSVGYTARIQ